MEALDIDLADVMTQMYEHYDQVTGAHRGISAGFLTALLKLLKVFTPAVIHTLGDVTDANGRFDFEKVAGLAERLSRSPRFLARVVA